MNRKIIERIISVLAGAAVLYGLERGLGVKIYIAMPAAVAVYFALRVAIGLLWGTDDKAT